MKYIIRSTNDAKRRMEKSPNLQKWELTQNSLPDDVALNIASFLQVSDVCSLGSCSRFWRHICASDFLWFSLFKQRWPSLDLSKNQFHRGTDGEESELQFSSSDKVWRSFYIMGHQAMACRATTIVKLVEESAQDDSLEVGDYLRAIRELCYMELGFKDVQLFLFTTKQNVLLNLIGLHYSLFYLGIPAEDISKALSSCQISERQVCVRWWKLGRWFHGFRLRDESRLRRVSLADLAITKDEEVMGVLHRGAIHEVLRIQISAEPARTTWVCIHPQP